MFNLPGNQMNDPRMRLAQQLMQQGASTAPVQHWSQGLGRLAQALVGAKMHNEVDQENTTATNAMLSGMNAKPWVNPDTGKAVGTGGGYEGGIAALQNVNSPAAGRLATNLMQAKAQQDIAQRQADAERAADQEIWMARFGMQNDAADARADRVYQNQLGLLEAKAGMTPETWNAPIEVTGPDGNAMLIQTSNLGNQRPLEGYTPKVEENKTGKYYVVPTARGQMLVDKGTGMAQMLGVGEDGSPVRIGQPFYPAEDSNGRPTAVPANMNVAELPQSGQPQQPATPLMTPAADPQTQYDVTSARERAKMDLEQPEKAKKARQTMQALERQWDVVDSTIDQVMASLDGSTAGFFGNMIGVVPGTDAYDVDKQIDTIKANIGFDRLQEMRENSPTGGALGAVSELELKLLQSVKGSLDQGQSPEQLKANLADIKRNLAALRQERQKAFAADYGSIDVGESLNKETSSPIPGNQMLSESETGFSPAGETVPMSDIVREARERGLIR
ncbi:MAG: hypothetical protein GYB19_10150 [Rhodospirillales bacterium]|nr:hypothetical protein [Rhodospirillales bacterium]